MPVPTYNITYRYTPGTVTLVSHSGGMAVNLFYRAQGRGIGVRALVTLGQRTWIPHVTAQHRPAGLGDRHDQRVNGRASTGQGAERPGSTHGAPARARRSEVASDCGACYSTVSNCSSEASNACERVESRSISIPTTSLAWL